MLILDRMDSWLRGDLDGVVGGFVFDELVVRTEMFDWWDGRVAVRF